MASMMNHIHTQIDYYQQSSDWVDSPRKMGNFIEWTKTFLKYLDIKAQEVNEATSLTEDDSNQDLKTATALLRVCGKKHVWSVVQSTVKHYDEMVKA